MRRVELAKLLISAKGARERQNLITQNLRIADEKLADEIRVLCYKTWTSEPIKARRAATAMKALTKLNDQPAILAAAFWVDGIASITKGRFEQAVRSLDYAVDALADLGRKVDVAQAQVAQLLALAMLGRYDEAIRSGRAALKILVASGDQFTAGKIEMNLSNIVSRRSLHREAVRYCSSARRRFIRARENSWQAMAENGLANSFMELNEFAKAERFYRAALTTTRQLKMTVTEAEIEASLGNLALMRGDYSAALRSLEVSRQRYDELAMPHQSAIAELEIADIYAELNLNAEAATIYGRLARTFTRLNLRAEQARTRLNLGRLLTKTGDLRSANRSLAKAQKLFDREKNISGKVVTQLALAEAALAAKDYAETNEWLDSARKLISIDESPRSVVRLELLRGIAHFSSGNNARSKRHLAKAIKLARKNNFPEALRIGETWLGRSYLKNNDLLSAADHFRKAIDVAERERWGLSGDEFTMSFSSTRLGAYTDLGELHIKQGRAAKAFEVFEKGRSRSLLGTGAATKRVGGATAKLIASAASARSELNLLYRRSDISQTDERSKLESQIAIAEKSLADLDRQIASLKQLGVKTMLRERFTVSTLQSRLPSSATLIEYVAIKGEILAFVVTKRGIDHVPSLTSESEITELLERLHFHLDTIRYGTANLEKFAAQLRAKTDHILSKFYDLLFRPLRHLVHGDRLMVVPAGPVNYVPFCALFDGSKYLVEGFEMRQSPSAVLWQQLANVSARKFKRPLLLGFADERIPLVENEIRSIQKVMPDAECLIGRAATFAAFSSRAGEHDVLHIACHGQFRPDNPMFSSLHLADGWVTVRDLIANKLSAKLVTLSACETGISKVFAGEEILGLVRGFLSAGARSMIVSLWKINDTATAKMMPWFYQNTRDGLAPAAALRRIQLDMIAEDAHPSLWAPFVYIGG